MSRGDLIALSVEVCNTLAPGTERNLSLRRGGMMISHDAGDEFAGRGACDVPPAVEHLPQSAGTDFTPRGNGGHGGP